MHRDDFIIATYCLVADELAQLIAQQPNQRLRQAGFAPKLTDAEVITIEICGEFFKMHTDCDILRHSATFSPTLPPTTALSSPTCVSEPALFVKPSICTKSST